MIWRVQLISPVPAAHALDPSDLPLPLLLALLLPLLPLPALLLLLAPPLLLPAPALGGLPPSESPPSMTRCSSCSCSHSCSALLHAAAASPELETALLLSPGLCEA